MILAFRGTQTLSDWGTDFYNAFGGVSSRYTSALNIGQMVQMKYAGHDITITGHSLGGGEGGLVSAATGLKAITFNAAGVDPSHYGVSGGTGQITNFRVWGEPLTTLQTLIHLIPSAVGNQVNQTPVTLPTLPFIGNSFNHGEGAVLPATGAPQPIKNLGGP